MRALVIVVVMCACGSSKTNDTPAAQKQPSTQPAAPLGKPSVAGTLELGGALSGTVHWAPDLTLTCLADRDVGAGFDVTMTDGKDTFLAFEYADVKNQPVKLQMTSGKLHADTYKATQGVKADIDNRRMTVTVDATFAHDASTVTMKGKLDFVCP